MKAHDRGQCQICAAQKVAGIAFRKTDGTAYAEAHHVMPVTQLIAGSLGAQNIMVLCPNHHRQAHYSRFTVLSEETDNWAVDDTRLRIEKTCL